MFRVKIRVLIAVIGLLIFLHYSKVILPLETGLIKSFSTVQNYFFKQSNKFNWFFSYLFNSNKLLSENELLRAQLAQLQLDEVQLKILITENSELKKSLNYLQQTNFQYQTAKIIGRSLQNPQLLILDQGKNSGLKENNIVIYNQGIVLGKIETVLANTAFLLLFTDNQSQIAAKSLDQEKTQGLVVGQLGINALLKMVPQEENLSPNDIIITSGLEENIPNGLLLGKITEIKSSDQSLFKEAIIQPFFDIRQINYVQIIIAK